ncbi:hypothetical protein MPSEU_000714800 [Mayamaea pseudoterrestris]|nr:hypothetical protein MPSEU_000714800 [Mayamaea pseudoterrestris]
MAYSSAAVDAAFTKLLSSQRELLNTMNQHTTARGAVVGSANVVTCGENTWQDSVQQQQLQPPPQQQTSNNVHQRRRSSLELVLSSRRLSIGSMGYDDFIIQTVPSYDDAGCYSGLLDKDWLHSLAAQQEFDLDWSESSNHKKRRRLSQSSSSMFLSDMMYFRRDSLLLSVSEERPDAQESGYGFTSKNDQSLSKTRPSVNECGNDKIWKRLDANALETFQKAMKHSESSRQHIHKSGSKSPLKLQLCSKMEESSLSRKRLFNVLPLSSADECASSTVSVSEAH